LDSGKAAERRYRRRSARSGRTIAARIRRAGDHTLRIAMETVGQVLAEERDKLRAEFKSELEREVAKLRNEFLQDRLDAERSTQKIKAVQSSPVSLIA
jgi:hypothetical protein